MGSPWIKDGTVWFAEFTEDGKIGKVDPKTLKVAVAAMAGFLDGFSAMKIAAEIPDNMMVAEETASNP